MKAARSTHYQDEYGDIRVESDTRLTSLFFDSSVAQSAWTPHRPEQLSFGYYRALILPLILADAPQNITILGLGGGALARFLLQFTPHQITCWDYRPVLAEIAQNHFDLDLKHPRLELHFGDITQAHWQPQDSMQDVILVDLFDHQAMVELPEPSVAKIIGLLRPGGVLAVNIWRNNLSQVVQLHRKLSQHLDSKALTAHIPERLNTVMCYRKQAWQFDDLQLAWQRREGQSAPVRRALEQAWRWIEPQNPINPNRVKPSCG
ncbi:MAG TPA: methyltransferase domain-containing protein [Halothiobacillaceae bacterium]|nr:methyltransferase domain-containing protein [Halothiobacillaceae bacterium]